jgi:hypothetical protein
VIDWEVGFGPPENVTHSLFGGTVVTGTRDSKSRPSRGRAAGWKARTRRSIEGKSFPQDREACPRHHRPRCVVFDKHSVGGVSNLNKFGFSACQDELSVDEPSRTPQMTQARTRHDYRKKGRILNNAAYWEIWPAFN